MRNRVYKALDHDGLQLVGALMDIFGRNGRRILKGLLAGWPEARILASLSGHLRRKRELLPQVLETALNPHSLLRLRGLPRTHSAVQSGTQELDGRLTASL